MLCPNSEPWSSRSDVPLVLSGVRCSGILTAWTSEGTGYWLRPLNGIPAAHRVHVDYYGSRVVDTRGRRVHPEFYPRSAMTQNE